MNLCLLILNLNLNLDLGTIIDVWFLALISLLTAAAHFIVSKPSTAATDGLIGFSAARGQSCDPVYSRIASRVSFYLVPTTLLSRCTMFVD